MERILKFKNRIEFRKWLEVNFEQKESIWIKLNKTDKTALKPSEALEEALCFGWIDSTIKRVDDTFYIKKFAKRRKKSNWSEFNKRLVEKLIKDGRMGGPGLRAIEAAKENGMWDRKDAIPEISEEMIKELRQRLIGIHADIRKFDELNPSSKRMYTGYYFSAKKEETRMNRLKRIIDSIENGPFLF